MAGTSTLWSAIPSSKKQLIRSFLNLLNLEILKRSRPPTSTFDFTSASVGNLFLTGARLFSGSFESAIYLLGSITGVPDDHIQVIPAINSNFTHHIAAQLADDSIIVGQNSISHPSEPTALETPTSKSGTTEAVPIASSAPSPTHSDEDAEDANPPFTLPTLRTSAIKFSKTPSLLPCSTTSPNTASPPSDDLPSRIIRIFYINPYGLEIRPPANPRVLTSLSTAQAIIYSIGSLYTSLIPSLILRGVGDAIRTSPRAARCKILILNGSLDREVGPSTEPYTALDFVDALVKACEEGSGREWTRPPAVDRTARHTDPQAQSAIYASYITHLIHLSGPGTPLVDRLALRALGIETVKLYRRPAPGPRPSGPSSCSTSEGLRAVGVGMRYDPKALAGAIETILGKKGAAMLDGDDDASWDGRGYEDAGANVGGHGEDGGQGLGAGEVGGRKGRSRSRRNTLEG